MYSSLRQIDIVGSHEGAPLYVQSDHRGADEILAEPEISTLFAICRLVIARRLAEREGAGGTIVYAMMTDNVPDVLLDVIAACGAQLGTPSNMKGRAVAPVAISIDSLIDRAFAELAQRVLTRTGVTDAAVALAILEAETVAAELDVEDDECGYWTRVLELAAVTGEIVRKRRGGTWEQSDRGELPFGFMLSDETGLFPTNRASRFVEDGPNESMFRMIATLDEQMGGDLPILPSLRSREDAVGQKIIFRPMLENADDPNLPVIAYGTDSPAAFGMLSDTRDDDREAMHVKALANLATQEVEIEEMTLRGFLFLVVTNNFFATEKLLDIKFMQGLHKKLGAQLLAVSVPRRGLMFVTDGVPKEPLEAMAILATLTAKEYTTSRKISPSVILVTGGEVVGHVKMDDGPPPPPKKKPGLFKRLFGRN